MQCRLCQEAVSAETKGRKRHGKFTCRVCETLHTMVTRKIGGSWLMEQSAEARSEFFKKARAAQPQAATRGLLCAPLCCGA